MFRIRMMSEGNNSKQFAIGAVARHFPADWQVGAGPPDAYATIDGRSVALDVAIITRRPRARPAAGTRLREDRVAQRVLRDIEIALSPRLADHNCIILTLGAPLVVPKKLVARLTTLLLDYIQNGRKEREEHKTVLGNRIRFRVLNQKVAWTAKVVGFVFSGDPKPGILADAMRSLHDAIASSTKARMPTGFTGDRWLVLSSAAWIADANTYRRMYSLLSLPRNDFKKIFLVSHGGRLEPLAAG